MTASVAESWQSQDPVPLLDKLEDQASLRPAAETWRPTTTPKGHPEQHSCSSKGGHQLSGKQQTGLPARYACAILYILDIIPCAESYNQTSPCGTLIGPLMKHVHQRSDLMEYTLEHHPVPDGQQANSQPQSGSHASPEKQYHPAMIGKPGRGCCCSILNLAPILLKLLFPTTWTCKVQFGPATLD